VASGDSEAQRQEFERRLLALVRWKFDRLDEDFPEGWEITEFVVCGRFYTAPEPDDDPKPWYGGPFPGWGQNGFTLGSSTTFWFDEDLLEESLQYTRNRQAELEADHDDDDDEDDEDEDEDEDEDDSAAS
jgi:hypothetical protein